MIDRLSVRVNGWMDRRAPILLTVFAVVLFVGLAARASATPFWHDEIFTVVPSRLSLPALWRGLRDGLDLMPPANTVLTHIVTVTAGIGEVRSRLPSLLAVVAASLLVFAIVRRRTNAITAWSASLLLCFTSASRYAYEARGYGLTVFCFALALFAWSEAVDGRSRRRNLSLLALAIALGIWAHYYAVLALLPVAFGEAARYARTRQFDRGVVLSLGAGLLATTPLSMLLMPSLRGTAGSWTQLQSESVREVYAFVMGPSWGSRFQAIAVVVAVVLIVGRWIWRQQAGPGRHLSASEVAAGVACLALPLAGLLIGSTVGNGIFADRYVLLATVGMAVAIPTAVWRLGPRNGAAELVLFFLLAIMFGRWSVQTVDPRRLRFHDPLSYRPVLTSMLSGPDPVVVTGGVDYLPLWYYATDDQRRRIVYLADPAAELEQTRTRSIDDGYLALERHADANVTDVGTFAAAHRTFWLYDRAPNWILPALTALGAVLAEEARESDAVVYRVTLPARPAMMSVPLSRGGAVR